MNDGKLSPESESSAEADPGIEALLGRAVVLDTASPVVYIGTLRAVGKDGFWLEDADVHNCNEGHAPKEQYVLESRLHGVRACRRRVCVLRHSVISLSALDDSIVE